VEKSVGFFAVKVPVQTMKSSTKTQVKMMENLLSGSMYFK
jgi:hypothetical protein